MLTLNFIFRKNRYFVYFKRFANNRPIISKYANSGGVIFKLTA